MERGPLVAEASPASRVKTLVAPASSVDAPKILLYSHDSTGLRNTRRTLPLADMLVSEYPGATQLIVSGSPMIHAFRIPERTDYIKLPCLERPDRDSYQPVFLREREHEVAEIRRGVLQSAILGFAPDLM